MFSRQWRGSTLGCLSGRVQIFGTVHVTSRFQAPRSRCTPVCISPSLLRGSGEICQCPPLTRAGSYTSTRRTSPDPRLLNKRSDATLKIKNTGTKTGTTPLTLRQENRAGLSPPSWFDPLFVFRGLFVISVSTLIAVFTILCHLISLLLFFLQFLCNFPLRLFKLFCFHALLFHPAVASACITTLPPRLTHKLTHPYKTSHTSLYLWLSTSPDVPIDVPIATLLE